MKYLEILDKIIYELKFAQNLTPNFTTSRKGIQIGFSANFMNLSKAFAKKIYDNDTMLHNIAFGNFLKITKQCVVDFYTEDKLNNLQNSSEIISALKKYIKESVLKEIKQFNYYIPVRTLGFEQIQDFSFGSI